jgi:hypothetical protein
VTEGARGTAAGTLRSGSGSVELKWGDGTLGVQHPTCLRGERGVTSRGAWPSAPRLRRRAWGAGPSSTTCSAPTWLRGCAASLRPHGGCWGALDPAPGTSRLRLRRGETRARPRPGPGVWAAGKGAGIHGLGLEPGSRSGNVWERLGEERKAWARSFWGGRSLYGAQVSLELHSSLLGAGIPGVHHQRPSDQGLCPGGEPGSGLRKRWLNVNRKGRSWVLERGRCRGQQ